MKKSAAADGIDEFLALARPTGSEDCPDVGWANICRANASPVNVLASSHPFHSLRIHRRERRKIVLAHNHAGGCNHRRLRQRIRIRSEEHTSELQSHSDLVCRLLLEKKKKKISG